MGRVSLPRALLLVVCLGLSFRSLTAFTYSSAWKNLLEILSRRVCDLGTKAPQEHTFIANLTETNIWADSLANQASATPKANATFIFLARNSELKAVVESIQYMEDRFNKKFQYPYVFLNDEPFTDEFKEWTSQMVSSKAEYGIIPREHWQQPDWIDEERAKAGRDKMVDENIIYGGSVSYRNMCRFNSGYFFRHPLILPYRWYWRIEPGVKFYCDIGYDPFLSMEDNNQVYGFNIALYELEETIPTLWKATKEFISKHPQYVASGNAMGFLSEDGGRTYNLCHFWSNFEIADMEFWRGEAYTAYFDWLESKGGFYYERWGDAPVHSIAASLFLRKEQLRFFDEIGYKHESFQHCPSGDRHKQGRCSCSPKDAFDWDYYSCLWEFSKMFQD